MIKAPFGGLIMLEGRVKQDRRPRRVSDYLILLFDVQSNPRIGKDDLRRMGAYPTSLRSKQSF